MTLELCYKDCDTICNTIYFWEFSMVTVRLDESLESQLNLYAQQEHIPKSKIIKEALVYYFDMVKNNSHQKTPYELGKDLFGKYQSNDGDLSTTYKQKIKEKIDAKNSHR